MPAPDDRRAAWVLFFIALLGAAVRWSAAPPGTAPGAVGLSTSEVARPSVDSVRVRSQRVARPLGPGETINIDDAAALELARLPGIGPGLAARIVEYRDSAGPFGSLAALDRVPGVGPALLGRIRGSATFNYRVRPDPAASASRIDVNRASVEELALLPGIGPVKARAIVRYRSANGSFRTVDALAAVPGIGSATVDRLRGSVRLP